MPMDGDYCETTKVSRSGTEKNSPGGVPFKGNWSGPFERGMKRIYPREGLRIAEMTLWGFPRFSGEGKKAGRRGT